MASQHNSRKFVIDLQTPSRRFSLEVDGNDSVRDVKKKIQEEEGVSWTEIKLTSNDSEMEDSSSVRGYFGLYGDEPRQLIVHCHFPAPSPPAVKIISHEGNSITLEVRGEEKVSVLKDALVRIGLPDDGWMLSHDDWNLIPGETLENQGVRDGVTIDLVPSSQPPEIPPLYSGGDSSGGGFLERKNFPAIQDHINNGERGGNPDIPGTANVETESEKKIESDDELPDLEDIKEEDEHDNEDKDAAQDIISMGLSECTLLSPPPVRIIDQGEEVIEMQVRAEEEVSVAKGWNLTDQGSTDWQWVSSDEELFDMISSSPEKPTVYNFLEPPWYERVVEQIPVTESVLTLKINLEKVKSVAADHDHVSISGGRPYMPDPMGKEIESEKMPKHDDEPKVEDVKEERKHDNEDADSEDDKNCAGESESWKKSH